MKATQYLVRPAQSTDFEKLVSFTLDEAHDAEGATKDEVRVRAGVSAALNDEAIARYWVLVADNEVVGNVSVVREWSDWHAGYYRWIQSMFIDSNHRGQGLMKRLLKAVTTAARDENVLELRLYVHRDNSSAIHAYYKSGFLDSAYQIMTMDIAPAKTRE